MNPREIPIFVGWDSREDIAYQVCRYSILRRASEPLKVFALRQKALRYQRLYWRDADPLASTEFTYTRFLVPALADYRGWVDNDAGIVTFRRGDRVYAYAVSFFTQDVPSKYADIPLGQAVSRLVWLYFDGRYR